MAIFNNMVELEQPRLDAVFQALSDSTRRRMLGQLAQGERTVGQLAQPYAMSLAAASKHIRALEGAGLIRREVRGRRHICRLEPGPLAEAERWLKQWEKYWDARLDRLQAIIERDSKEDDNDD